MRKPLLLLIAAALVLAAALLHFLTGKKPSLSPPPAGDAEILIDCTVRRVATVGGDGFRSVSLCRRTDGSCEVVFRSFYESDEQESLRAVPADASLVDDVYRLLDEAGVARWNEEKLLPGPDGAVYELSFLKEDGTRVLFTSDAMPEDGLSVFSSVMSLLEHAADPEG